MKPLIASSAYRLRWAVRFLLCRYRNLIPPRQTHAHKQVQELHRLQKEEYRAQINEHFRTEVYEALNRADIDNKLALFNRPYRNCLEIGCESGWFGRLLLDRGLVQGYVGIDIRPEDLSGKERSGSLLVNARAESLPLRDGAFDLVVAFHVLEHIAHPALLRRELERVTTPSATAAVAVPLGYDNDPCHYRRYMTAWGWKRFLRRRYGLRFQSGGVVTTTQTELVGLFDLRGNTEKR